MSDRYAVFGNPIGHSKSPIIHAAFARQTGQDITYEAILAPLDGFAETVDAFIASGGRGANVTVPFKQEAFQLVTRLTPRAELAGASNTLIFSNGEIIGDNTDGVGLIRDITINLGRAIAGQRVLLLGAGGAARGVIGPLLDEHPASLVVANRTESKTHILVGHFAHLGPISGCDFPDLAGQSFDIVINATSASLQGTMPALPNGIFAPGSLSYKMMYGLGDTPFRIFSRDQGAAMISEGLGMLLEQAAEAFYVWRGVRPTIAPVIDLLNKA